MTPADFRAILPEFTDTTRWPDAQVSFWLAQGVLMLNEVRWGELLQQGLALYTAHQLALSDADRLGAASRIAPGTSAPGVVSSQSVGGASISYDTTSATEQGAGHWNLTTYGTRYLHLARQVGTGPVQVAGSDVDLSASAAAGAWPGPYNWPY